MSYLPRFAIVPLNRHIAGDQANTRFKLVAAKKAAASRFAE